MLDSRRLRVLCEVAKHGSFSAAAAALGYTQPAISRQVATLEAEVGATLVRRVPQGALLTDAGRVLVSRAELILARLQDAQAEVRAMAGLQGGTLRLAAFGSAAASFVPLAIARFRTRHPAVELSIAMADPFESIPRLIAGQLDLALSNDAMPKAADRCDSPVATTGGGLATVELVHLFDDPMYVAMPLDHPLAEARKLSLSNFAQDPWMLARAVSCPDAGLFLRACHSAGFEPRIAFESNDYPAILGLVAAGVGVALIPDMVSRDIRSDVVVRDLNPAPPPRPVVAVLPAGYRAPAANTMLAILQEVSEAWVADRRLLKAA